jgi:hypothetical protein
MQESETRGFRLPMHMESRSLTLPSTTRLARRILALASASAVMVALLLVQAGAASADVFDELGAGFNGPSISSDKADYAPGETVVLSGSGWLPGEHVHITVNDDVGQTWIRESDVNADAGGSLSDEFQLPDSFIARYAVTAVGDASGTATTTFTDGNLKVVSALGRDFGFTATLYTNTSCSGTGTTSDLTAVTNGTNAAAGGNTESVLITANLNANSPNQAAVFSNWTTPGSPTAQLAPGYSLTDRAVCIVGFQSGSRDLVGNYVVVADATPPTVSSINRANSDPTSTTGNVSWTVTFSESVTGVDAADFALVNPGLGGTPAITNVTGSGASYTVTSSTGTGSGTLRLNLNDNDSITDAAANKLGGTGTGSVGSGGAGNGSFEGQLYTIDRAAPTIAATAITLPDPPGTTYVADTWTNQSVRVTFTCTDSGGSGKATDTASGNTDVTAETSASGTTVNSSGTCTDNAGNTAAGASFGPIKIDKTAPTITDLLATTSPNLAGWYKTNVTNRFKASDSLSGLDSACLTAFPNVSGERIQSKTTSGEGTDVKVSSDACTDNAGNTAAAIQSAGFKIDTTAPTISASAKTLPLPGDTYVADTWTNKDVRVTFTCTDGGPSGTATDTASGHTDVTETTTTVSSAGECTDNAGNSAAGASFGPVKIDKTAPTIAASAVTLPLPGSPYTADTWTNQDVRVTFTCTDGGGSGKATDTASGHTDVTETTATVSSAGECTDNAGNSAVGASFGPVKIDKTAPTIAASAITLPDPPGDTYVADTWTNKTVRVTFSCTDSGGSGKATDTASGDTDVEDETTGTTVNSAGECTDNAGNSAAGASFGPVKIDKTDPTIAASAITLPLPGDAYVADTWTNQDVRVTFTCTDSGGSGKATDTASGDTDVTETTATVSSAGECTDNAGNSAVGASFGPVKIDKTAPTIAASAKTLPLPGDAYVADTWTNQDVRVTFTCTDGGGSGKATDTASGHTDVTETTTTVSSTGECTDNAGNSAAGASFGPVKIDKTAPTIAASAKTLPLPGDAYVADTWTNQDVRVTFTCTDSGGSGKATDTASGHTDVTETTTTVSSAGECTDNAGNSAAGASFGPVKIDKTAPTIAASAITLPDPPGDTYVADTWTNKSVRVKFSCTDTGGSGKATDTASGDTDLTTNTTTSGTTVNSAGECTDNAGNSAAGASFGPVKIDKTAPSITDLGPTTDPNLAGWYKTNVVNEFKASDSLSGLDSDCLTAYPDVGGERIRSKTVTSEGTAEKVTSDQCRDVAGNLAAGIDSASFKIDKSAPTSHADSPDATNDSPFTVDYTASDQATLSGLERVELYVRTPETGTGYVLAATDSSPSGSGSFSYTPTAGEGTYRFYTVAYDVAGNVETSPVTYDTVTDVETGTPDTTTIFDQTPPVTTDDADDNWHNEDVTVTLSADDEDGGSGVDKTFYKVDGAATFSDGTSVVIGAPSDHSNDGPHTIYYYSTDKAGNEELTNQATVKIDTRAPSVAYTSATPAANANGWRKVDVTATFTATDTLSGFAGPSSTKTGTSTTNTEGSAVKVGSPVFTDLAGNVAVAGAVLSDPFKIDKTNPTLAPVVTPNPVTLGGTATVASNANDTLSTLDTHSCGALNPSTVGTKSVTCTATDKAGNSDSQTVNYGVQYGWNGFLQPINDTAHQTGLTQSRFKLGSTVPAKFVLRNAAGQSVQQATNPTFTRTNRLRACDANAVSEPLPGDILPDGGASYSWDGGQYHYNWSTKGIKDSGVYRIYANLADGTQRWVDICLW